MKEIKLKTPKDVCEQANVMDSGLHEEELPKFSFKAYFCKVFGKMSGKFNITVRW